MIWNNPKLLLPTQCVNVLIAVSGKQESDEAFYLKGKWIYSDGHDVPAGKVYAWAALPACPPKTSSLKPLRLRRRTQGGRA